jgi:hypothetical protein
VRTAWIRRRASACSNAAKAAKHTALGGLLDGTLRFGWGRPDGGLGDGSREIEAVDWDDGAEGIA